MICKSIFIDTMCVCVFTHTYVYSTYMCIYIYIYLILTQGYVCWFLRERGKEKEKYWCERETSKLAAFRTCPSQGSNLQLRHVPGLAIKLTTLWCMGWCSNPPGWGTVSIFLSVKVVYWTIWIVVTYFLFFSYSLHAIVVTIFSHKMHVQRYTNVDLCLIN